MSLTRTLTAASAVAARLVPRGRRYPFTRLALAPRHAYGAVEQRIPPETRRKVRGWLRR